MSGDEYRVWCLGRALERIVGHRMEPSELSVAAADLRRMRDIAGRFDEKESGAWSAVAAVSDVVVSDDAVRSDVVLSGVRDALGLGKDASPERVAAGVRVLVARVRSSEEQVGHLKSELAKFEQERDELRDAVGAAETRAQRLESELAEADGESEQLSVLEEKYARVREQRDDLVKRLSRARAKVEPEAAGRVESERDAARSDVDALSTELASVRERVSAVESERDDALSRLASVESERDAARSNVDALSAELASVRERVSVVESERDAALSRLASVVADRDAAFAERDAALVGFARVCLERDSLVAARDVESASDADSPRENAFEWDIF
jgi:predicted  nucleic acid-binding Zn-ribbon protein